MAATLTDEVENRLKIAWKTIESFLNLENYKSESVSEPTASFWTAVDLFVEYCEVQLIEEWFLDKLRRMLTNEVAPKFWRHFKDHSGEVQQSAKSSQVVSMAVNELETSFSKLASTINCIQMIREKFGNTKSFAEKVKVYYKGILLSQLPLEGYNSVLERFFIAGFKAYGLVELKTKRLTGDNSSSDESQSLICEGCERDADSCDCDNTLEEFYRVTDALCKLDLLERVAGEALTNVIHEHIRQHINSTCKGNFETQYLTSLETWLDAVVISWLKTIYRGHNKLVTCTETSSSLDVFKGRLLHFMYETYAYVRLDELFNMIIEFPDSQPAVEDLKACLEKTSAPRNQLVHSLKMALETRLLLPGANTNTILAAYSSTVKTLAVLDGTGVLYETVCEPFHKYLRTRSDTVRCIVSELTDETSSELADELCKGGPLNLDDSYQSEDDCENWEDWMPDPIYACPDKILKGNRTSDVISLLVNIYGTKDVFVKTYRSLLAERILAQYDFDIQKEIRCLELLKLRFGESELSLGEVMLKDVADSRRINMHIHSEDMEAYHNEEFPLKALIVSAQCWPSLREERLELPPEIQSAFEKYTKAFETLKGNRTLNWKTHLGLVDLEIELKGRTLNLRVSPIHATIIMHFEKQPRWTLEELSTATRVPSTNLKRKIALWQSKGVIVEESTDVFVLQEEEQAGNKDPDALMLYDEDEGEAEAAMTSFKEQREEELHVCWSYVVGMLTNLESLPLERIHSMLKMFAVQSPTATDVSMAELREFLNQKVKEQKLIYSAGLYRLPKFNMQV